MADKSRVWEGIAILALGIMAGLALYPWLFDQLRERSMPSGVLGIIGIISMVTCAIWGVISGIVPVGKMFSETFSQERSRGQDSCTSVLMSLAIVIIMGFLFVVILSPVFFVTRGIRRIMSGIQGEPAI